MLKKNKFIIGIPIKTYASREEIEKEVKSILCDYEITGYLELEHPISQFDTKKTEIDYEKTKVNKI